MGRDSKGAQWERLVSALLCLERGQREITGRLVPSLECACCVTWADYSASLCLHYLIGNGEKVEPACDSGQHGSDRAGPGVREVMQERGSDPSPWLLFPGCTRRLWPPGKNGAQPLAHIHGLFSILKEHSLHFLQKAVGGPLAGTLLPPAACPAARPPGNSPG